MRFIILVFVFICSAALTSALSAQETPISDLSKQAVERRQAAELLLTQQRARILSDRQALLNILLAEQEKLQALRIAAEAAQQEHQDLAALKQQRDLQARTQQGDMRLRIERACAALGLPSFESENIKAFQEYVQAKTNELFQELDQNTHIRMEQGNIAGRDGSPVKATLIYCGAVQALALAESPQNSGLLLSSGKNQVINGPMISTDAFHQLQSLTQMKSGFLLADLDGSLVKQRVVEITWQAWLQKGGFFVWPICLVGLVAALLASERIIYLLRLQMNPGLSVAVMEALQQNNRQQAQALVAARANPLQRVLDTGIQTLERKTEEREAALDASLLDEESGLERSRSLLAVLAAVAPLLGLLGTVTGMIATFQSIALYGTANPALLSNGISEALITTQLGLVVAVPILLVHGVINRLADKRRIILEQSAIHMMTCSASQT